MPQTKLEFDFGIGPAVETSMRAALSFLRGNPDLAYNVSELQELGIGDPDTISAALKNLVLFGALDERFVEGEWYYRYIEDVPELASP
jgi:hypothetical protein